MTTKPGAKPLLRLGGVSRTFGDYKALHPTTFEVNEGEFFSLLGPSGCGKTTTLRIIAGFETPDTGTVTLAGKDITYLPANLRDTNTVFQSYALFPHMTAEENVSYPLRMKGVPSAESGKRVGASLERVSMSEFARRLPHEMSGGQRQRVALAIVGEPKVLLLDEPLGALDLKLREQMQHVLIGLQKSLGITFVYVTHDQGEALSMSDRIAVMKSGSIQQLGTPDEIYYSPANAFVSDFIGKSNLIQAEAVTEKGKTALKAGGLRIPAQRSAGRKAGGTVSVRFEAVKIGTVDGCDVQADATVLAALFFGNVVEVALDAGGQRLMALMPSRRGARLAVGENVRVGFSSADVVHLDG
jgi:spermidine/putrescine transport system ATP-binding protein